MPPPIIIVDQYFFVKAARQFPEPRCYSIVLGEELRIAADKKNLNPHDRREENLLFPPSILEKTLNPAKVRALLSCCCTICSAVQGRDLSSVDFLVDAVTKKEGGEERRLFALLAFIGAGFAARHVCASHMRGWDIPSNESSLQSELFEPLKLTTKGIFPSPEQTTRIFINIFRSNWNLFNTPIMRIGSHITNLTGENLPFIEETHLDADKSSFGSLFYFKIHPEFRGDCPQSAVRKELVSNETTAEERRILEFLAKCGKPNFVQLLFWYRRDDRVNYVFPLYPGSLNQVLEGKMDGRITPVKPVKYRTTLQHWLWQGMVEVVAAMKWFHFPDQSVLSGQLFAAHFDLKPANILVDKDGVLWVADFGQARIKQHNQLEGTSLTAQGGDPQYQPPPTRKPSNPQQAGLSNDIEMRWNRAYDVWSLACIMTEVIEYITQGGAKGVKAFRDRRRKEDPSSTAFWKANRNGPVLRASVQQTLHKFRGQDQYLNMVTDLLEDMFKIDPLQRPPMGDCLAIIAEDVPTDEWPLKDDDELSIAGLGTKAQLRNMHTQFQRKSEPNVRRCKMYLLSSTDTKRIRLALEFEKEIGEGTNIACVLSDSARRGDEELKMLSLFEANYKPRAGRSYKCAFEIVHPNLTFIFDDSRLGPQEYYQFLTAATRQRSLRPQVYMPISKCTYKVASFLGKKEIFREGHVQIWKELTTEEYNDEFTYIQPIRKQSDASHFEKRESLSSASGIARMESAMSMASISSGSSGSTVRVAPEAKTYRLLIFLPDASPRVLSINLTNRFNTPRMGRTGEGAKSETHITFTAVGGNFRIGNFTTKKNCPGIPLNPATFTSREQEFHVDWVELEFKDLAAMAGFRLLWSQLHPPHLSP